MRSECCVPLIREKLFPIVRGKNPFSISALWNEMNSAVRNFGRHGIASVRDCRRRNRALGFESKNFESAARKIARRGSRKNSGLWQRRIHFVFRKTIAQTISKLGGEGISMVKMKIGREPERDETRVKSARKAIGEKIKLFVDANGAFTPKQALNFAEKFSEQNVRWFEEPVSSDDLCGLRFFARTRAGQNGNCRR